jgi:hypothetical protein
LSLGVPLLFVPRTDWPEEEHLSRFIMHYDAGICLSEEQFLSGFWEEAMNTALEKKRKGWNISELNVDGALEEVESKIRRIIDRTI